MLWWNHALLKECFSASPGSLRGLRAEIYVGNVLPPISHPSPLPPSPPLPESVRLFLYKCPQKRKNIIVAIIIAIPPPN